MFDTKKQTKGQFQAQEVIELDLSDSSVASDSKVEVLKKVSDDKDNSIFG